MVAVEVGLRVRSWIQAASQDDIAVGDADSAISIVWVGLKARWRIVAFESVERDLGAFDMVRVDRISGRLLVSR